MDYKSLIAGLIEIEGIDRSEIESYIEVPKEGGMGDYAFPCFKLSKVLRKAPPIIAAELKSKITLPPYLSDIQAVGGYLNFFLNNNYFLSSTVKDILKTGDKYGNSDIGRGKTVCIDYSSINIAKPFHIGHLSTTVIGAALYRIYKALGYDTVGINHLGDWGTQFGKLIVAYKKWGSRAGVEAGGIRELLRLYVKFHDEAEKDPVLDEQGRMWFKRIEDGDKEAYEIFDFFKNITLAEVSKVYERLGITFDSYAGESFYNDKMQPVLDELEAKGLLVESEGAKVVELEGMPPCLLMKADGATLYATRDIAAVFYRKRTYDFYKCLYVVAYQQNLHFRQWFEVVRLMGYDWAADLQHVAFGMVSLEDGTLST
jgi:arginyl-tRNA synthetase